jgi:hypothetical protein
MQHIVDGCGTVELGAKEEPSSRHLSPKVRVFVDHLGSRLAGPP